MPNPFSIASPRACHHAVRLNIACPSGISFSPKPAPTSRHTPDRRARSTPTAAATSRQTHMRFQHRIASGMPSCSAAQYCVSDGYQLQPQTCSRTCSKTAKNLLLRTVMFAAIPGAWRALRNGAWVRPRDAWLYTILQQARGLRARTGWTAGTLRQRFACLRRVRPGLPRPALRFGPTRPVFRLFAQRSPL